jgi:hypothetical protein
VLSSNLGFASASHFHHSVFAHARQASLRHRRGVAASSRWQFRLRFDFAVVFQRVYARDADLASASQWPRSVSTLAMQASLQQRRAYSCWQCEPRFGFAVASQRLHAVNEGFALASQWHCSVFMLAMLASLRLRSCIAASSRCQCRLRFGFAVASQRLHAGNAGLASASLWHHSVFTLASQRLHAVNFGLATTPSQWYCSVFVLVTQTSLRLCSGFVESSR